MNRPFFGNLYPKLSSYSPSNILNSAEGQNYSNKERGVTIYFGGCYATSSRLQSNDNKANFFLKHKS
jgi:hypothetical protein